VAGAAVAALAVWAIADPLAGVDLRVRTGTTVQEVGPVAVAVVAVLVSAAGLALLALLERLMRRGRTAWLITACVVAVLSLLGPAGGVTAGAKLSLACMHIAVAAVLIGVVAGTAERRRPETAAIRP
jgi:hypothetical protein